MKRLDTIPVRRALAAYLALSLVFCCCHAHRLVGSLAIAADAPLASAALPPCCSGCIDDSAPAGTDDDAPTPASDGCGNCCIKGTGEKDGTPVLVHVCAAMPALPVPAVLLPALTPSPVIVADRGAAPGRVESPTLLRLRCALIV